MQFYVQYTDNAGFWAGKEKALDYLAQGFHIFKDADRGSELTEKEIESDDDGVIKAPECKTEKVESSASKED